MTWPDTPKSRSINHGGLAARLEWPRPPGLGGKQISAWNQWSRLVEVRQWFVNGRRKLQ